MESPMAEQKLQYWRQLDKTTIVFYFNVENAATGSDGITHDAGAEVKLSQWVKSPQKKEIQKLQENYIRMSEGRTLMIGNCNAKIMLPEIYETQYGFLDTGEAQEISVEEYNEKYADSPGPISTRANLERK